ALGVFLELPRVARTIFLSTWGLAIRAAAPFFVLGDAPGIGFQNPRDNSWFLFVPISPERAVIVRRHSSEGIAAEFPAGNALNMNRLAYEASEHRIVARDRTELEALIP